MKVEKYIQGIKKHPLINKLVTLAMIIFIAWLLGQLLVPVLMKKIFL